METILTLPNPLLRQVASIVVSIDDTLHQEIHRLECAMQQGPGGVGIAAPQLGICKRMIIVDCSLAQRPCRHHGRLIMLNPQVIEKYGEVMGREGCLSVPDWVATVPRAKTIIVQYLDMQGQLQVLETKAFEARVIQHEIDHLDGILFADRVLNTQDMVRRLQQHG